MVARPLETSASQKASPLTLTSYGKVEPNGTAGKHGYTFEFPDGHPKHSPMECILSKAKAGAHTTNSGNYFSTLAARNGWAGSVGVMWRLTHDPVRHFLHARKPMAIAMDNISLKHSPMDFLFRPAKAGAHTTNSGNYFSSLAVRKGWAGSVGVMWRLAHDPVRHALHARKPMVITMGNISLKKGIPMKVLWIKHSEVNPAKPPEDPSAP